MLNTETSHTVAGNYFSYSNLLDSTTDVPIAAFADKISSVLIHEMIHLGDMQQCKSFESPINVYAELTMTRFSPAYHWPKNQENWTIRLWWMREARRHGCELAQLWYIRIDRTRWAFFFRIDNTGQWLTLIHLAMYMNTYYSDENLLKKLPKDQQPPATEVNGPYGLKEKKN